MPRQKSVLAHSFYKPAIGGHAPGDIRGAFLEAIDAYEGWEPGEPEPMIEVRDRPMRLSAVCGLVWNCRDIMPSLEQRQLEDILPGRHFGDDRTNTLSTYARAARAMRETITPDA